MKRYLVLLAVAAMLGAIGLVAGRSIRLAPRPESVAMQPEVALEITIGPGARITPAVASVPKDHRVRLTITNRDMRAASITLAGYEDRLGELRVAPDSLWRGEFVADRPGQDFAWMLAGAPAGRLEVAGSHLVEGHR